MSDDDPLLARARLLLEAAKQTSEILKPTITIDVPARSTKTKTNKESVKGVDRLNKVFGATVFKGSTLINTHEDVRQFVGRGDQIVVDGYCCTIAQNGEWTPTCIEITSDFPGENNFSATLAIATANNILNSPKRKKPMVPVASESILQAVEQLNGFKEMYANKLETIDTNIEKKSSSGKIVKGKKTKPRSTVNDLPYQSSFLSSNGGNGGLGSGYADSYNFQPPNIPLSSSSAFPANSLYSEYTAYSARDDYGGTNVAAQNSPKFSNKINAPIEYPLSEVEQNNVINRRILEFNEQRKKESHVDPVKLASNRVRQKQLEEAKVKELQELEKEKRRQAEVEASELKAKELQARTQERVAKYKESLLKKAEEERQKAESELLARKEREKELASENYKKKLIEHRKQSQKRLRQIELENERREQEKHLQMQQKLDAISKKFDVLSTYAPPSVMARRIQQSKRDELGSEEDEVDDDEDSLREGSRGANSRKAPTVGVTRPTSGKASAVNQSGRVRSAQKSQQKQQQKPHQQPSVVTDQPPWDPYAEIDPDFAGLYGTNGGGGVVGGDGVSGNAVAAAVPRKFQPIPRGEDEWSEDGEGDLDEDSIELSKHSNSVRNNRGGGGTHKQQQMVVGSGNSGVGYGAGSGAATQSTRNGRLPKYPSRDESDNVSDVSGDEGNNTQLRGADLLAYAATQKSSSAKGPYKPSMMSGTGSGIGSGSTRGLPPQGRPSSQPLTPQQHSSAAVTTAYKLPIIKKQVVSNSNSASSLLANQQYQQQHVQQVQQSVSAMRSTQYHQSPRLQQQQQQQQQLHAGGPPLLPVEAQRQQQQQSMSATSSNHSPKKSATGVWRKLQPIPVAPYKPVPTATER